MARQSKTEAFTDSEFQLSGQDLTRFGSTSRSATHPGDFATIQLGKANVQRGDVFIAKDGNSAHSFPEVILHINARHFSVSLFRPNGNT